MRNGLVSVIIPTYNRYSELKNALDSVIVQDYRPIEIIIIDDHSNDHTWDILHSYDFCDIHFNYAYNISNLWPGITRNIGIQMAKGEYIALLDSDDIWVLSNKITEQVSFLENNSSYWFVSTRWIVADKSLENGLDIHFFTTDKDFRQKALFHYLAHTSTWVFKINIFHKIWGFWLHKTEDYEYLLRIATITQCFSMPIYSELHQNNLSWFYQKHILSQWLWWLFICIKYRNHYPGFYTAIFHRLFRGIYKWFKRFILRL